MTDEEIQRIARDSAEQATRQTLETLGLDVDNPRETQADLQVLRGIRRSKERGSAAAIWIAITMLVGGVLTIVWDAISKAAPK